MTTDLVEFLRAREAEREQMALAATPGPWHWDGDKFEDDPPEPKNPTRDGWGDSGPDLMSGDEQVMAAWGYDASGLIVKRADAEHIARWDPARVLREVEAKRRVIDLHGRGDEPSDHLCRECANPYPCETVRLLALPDAGHPDYRAEEWAP